MTQHDCNTCKHVDEDSAQDPCANCINMGNDDGARDGFPNKWAPHEELTLNEYQRRAMTTCMPSCDNPPRKIRGSYFPDEAYCFDDCDDKLPLFVEMLKGRGYYIGPDWHVRSKKGTISSKLMRNGYYMTSAQHDRKIYYFMEHRVIWCWLKGAIPAGLVVNHKDYNRTNNNIDNLELMTQKENTEYSRCNQNPPRGGKSGKAKLTNKQAAAVRYLRNILGWQCKDISSIFKICDANVGRIAKGKRYPDVVDAETIWAVYPIVVDLTRNIEVGAEEEVKDYALGICGEVGEVVDYLKKILYHGKEYNPTELMNELGDLLYYITALCNILGIDMTEIMLNNNAKLLARYPDGFSHEASNERIEDKRNVIDGNGDNR